MFGDGDQLSSHSLKLYWGDSTLYATSIKRTASSASEVDITSMESLYTEDFENTDHKMVWKEVDTGIADPGEFSVDFFASRDDVIDVPDSIGCTRTLRVVEIDDEGGESDVLSWKAFLSQCSFDQSVGQFVNGSVTFRLSGYRET